HDTRFALAFDPDLAAFPDFLFPDRDGDLERIDRVATSLERRRAVGRGNGHHDAGFADLEPAEAVPKRDAALPAACDLRRELAELSLRHRPISFIFQVEHPARTRVVAYRSRERRDR